METTKITKIEIDVYRCLSKEFFGIENGEDIIELTGRIFNILANNPNEAKNYYRIPTKAKVTREES